jgi:hypothetical protein
MKPPAWNTFRACAAAGAMAAAMAVAVPASPALAQAGGDDIQIFGYFQSRFSVDTQIATQEQQSTFTVQQLNIFLRRPINTRWTSFVNFEAVNSYSSERGWGAFNLEEAWVSYQRGPGLTVKMGLLIPRFNRLNEIKNRMPLLPYIIRPLVYESSFSELIAVDEFIPRRAYAQLQGSRRADEVRFDYAAYVGNSRHVNANESTNFTGVDTTDFFMGGGRLGLRHKDTELGVSFTGEMMDLNDFFPDAADSLGLSRQTLDDTPFTRLGVDFTTRFRRASLESEFISIVYHEDVAGFNIDKQFGYVTLGYQFTDRWFAYATYWETRENYWFPYLDNVDQTFRISGGGFSCVVNDRVTLKGQAGTGTYESRVPGLDLSEYDFDHTSLAVSVFF